MSVEDRLAGHAAEIAAAAERIRGHVRRTPLLQYHEDGLHLLVKPELFQVTGSFKPRGAFNAVLSLVARDPGVRGVVAVSSGNHAQAVALAARTAGKPAVILIPHDANPAKVVATRALGAEVITEGITFANREQRGREVVAERGFVLVHPYDDWDVIHGAGTAVREALEDAPARPGLVVTPTGGGGLLSGSSLSAHAVDPAIEVYGVEPEAADDAARSLAQHRIVALESSPATMADGVRTMSIGARNFEVMAEDGHVAGIATVSEDEIAEATVFAWTRLKLAVEPTGALALAALRSGRLPATSADRPALVVLSGGNADLRLVSRLLAGAVSR